MIIRKKTSFNQAQDVRCYSEIETFTDHKLVKTIFNIKWYTIKYNKPEIKLKTDLANITLEYHTKNKPKNFFKMYS